MAKHNCWIDDGHIKVRWLLTLAIRRKGPWPEDGYPSILRPENFPNFKQQKDLVEALETELPNFGMWFPPEDSERTPSNPPAHIVRNIARLFGFAPPSGADDAAIWRAWWMERWPSFTPRETYQKTVAPADAFKAQYRAALAAGTLKFLPPVLAPQRKKAVPARPSAAQAQDMADLIDLIDRLLAQVAEVPRLGNMVGSVLEGPLHRLRDLPDQSRWDETDFDQLLTAQEALHVAFPPGDAADQGDVFHFGALAPLLQILAKMLDLLVRQEDCTVIVNNELEPYLRAARQAVTDVPLDAVPEAVRVEVRRQLNVLGDYLDVAEAKKRIDLRRVDRMAGRVRQFRIGVLCEIDHRIAILIGKRAERAPPGAIFRDELGNGDVGPEMVVIPDGEFLMGSPDGEGHSDERPQHLVVIARRIAVGRFAVTFEEWDAALSRGGVKQNPDDKGWGRGRRPVINVSWEDATAYAAWLSGATGKEYRLPSEAEWEYCCRARKGKDTPFWWGSSISTSQANYDGNYTYGDGPKGEYREQTVPVDSFAPNPFGLYQVHGNVWEWCADNWHENYSGDPPTDGSIWAGGNSSLRVLRGGSWSNDPHDLRSAYRDHVEPDRRGSDVGFRVARTLSPPTP